MMDAMDAIGAKGAASGPDLEGRGLRLSFGPGSKERHCPVMDAGQGSTPSSTRLPAATAHASAGRRVGRANGRGRAFGHPLRPPPPPPAGHRRVAPSGARICRPRSPSTSRGRQPFPRPSYISLTPWPTPVPPTPFSRLQPDTGALTPKLPKPFLHISLTARIRPATQPTHPYQRIRIPTARARPRPSNPRPTHPNVPGTQ